MAKQVKSLKIIKFMSKNLHISKNSYIFAQILGKLKKDFIGNIVN